LPYCFKSSCDHVLSKWVQQSCVVRTWSNLICFPSSRGSARSRAWKLFRLKYVNFSTQFQASPKNQFLAVLSRALLLKSSCDHVLCKWVQRSCVYRTWGNLTCLPNRECSRRLLNIFRILDYIRLKYVIFSTLLQALPKNQSLALLSSTRLLESPCDLLDRSYVNEFSSHVYTAREATWPASRTLEELFDAFYESPSDCSRPTYVISVPYFRSHSNACHYVVMPIVWTRLVPLPGQMLHLACGRFCIFTECDTSQATNT